MFTVVLFFYRSICTGGRDRTAAPMLTP